MKIKKGQSSQAASIFRLSESGGRSAFGASSPYLRHLKNFGLVGIGHIPGFGIVGCPENIRIFLKAGY